jgi:hypothetical protein
LVPFGRELGDGGRFSYQFSMKAHRTRGLSPLFDEACSMQPHKELVSATLRCSTSLFVARKCGWCHCTVQRLATRTSDNLYISASIVLELSTMLIIKPKVFQLVQVRLNPRLNKLVGGLNYQERNGKKIMFPKCSSSDLPTSTGSSQNESCKTGMHSRGYLRSLLCYSGWSTLFVNT